MELFSDVTEEKQNSAIKSNIPEAKSNKVVDTYVYVGRFVSAKRLDDVLGSLREVDFAKAYFNQGITCIISIVILLRSSWRSRRLVP
jgi:hypothetical protein